MAPRQHGGPTPRAHARLLLGLGCLLGRALGGAPPSPVASRGLELVASRVGLSQLAVQLPHSADGAEAGEGGVLTVTLLAPADADELSETYAEHPDVFEGRAPYYGALWPSALALAREVDAHVAAGEAVLELGAGLGLVGIAAALRAAPSAVTLVDHDPVAVELALASARLNGVGERVRGAALDWSVRAGWPSADVDVVLAADVLYEAEASEHVAAVADRVLRPGGRLVLADGAHRPFRPLLHSCMRARGFRLLPPARGGAEGARGPSGAAAREEEEALASPARVVETEGFSDGLHRVAIQVYQRADTRGSSADDYDRADPGDG